MGGMYIYKKIQGCKEGMEKKQREATMVRRDVCAGFHKAGVPFGGYLE